MINLSSAISNSPQWFRNRVLLPAWEKGDKLQTQVRGRYLFDYDWDIAIILDALRYDTAKNVVPGHSIGIGVPERVYSVGSMSSPWINRTIANAPVTALQSTSYISANPHIDEVADSPLTIDPVWDYGWDDDRGVVPPRTVTDRTISLMHSGDSTRYVAHYMQPHLPPVVEADYDKQSYHPWVESGDRWENATWERVSNGGLDPAPVIKGYVDNLKHVLSEVEILLENVDATKVIITADHGNYLGEKERWGHPRNHIHPAVRYVPWWETTATNKKTHSPREYQRSSNIGRQEKLRALGYVD